MSDDEKIEAFIDTMVEIADLDIQANTHGWTETLTFTRKNLRLRAIDLLSRLLAPFEIP